MKKGFTLIELVIVIVILGILSAVAIPKFVDLTTKAKEAATKGALGALRSAIAIEYANYAATYDGATAWPNVTDIGSLMHDGKVPKNAVTNSTVVSETYASTNGWFYTTDGRIYACNDTVNW